MCMQVDEYGTNLCHLVVYMCLCFDSQLPSNIKYRIKLHKIAAFNYNIIIPFFSWVRATGAARNQQNLIQMPNNEHDTMRQVFDQS